MVFVVERIFTGKTGGNSIQVRLRLSQCGSRLEPPQHPHSHAHATVQKQRLGPLADGNDDGESLPHNIIAGDHAHNGVKLVVQSDSAADYLAIRAETGLPEIRGEHSHRRSALAVLIAVKSTTEDGR